MQIGDKRTTLKDDAALYSHETDKLTDREKMQSLKGRKKWIQFRDYYLGKIIAVTLVVVILGAILKTVFTPKKEEVLYIAVCDSMLDEENANLIKDELSEFYNIDPSKQQITVDTAYYFAHDYYTYMQKYTVYVATGTIGITIMPESVFKQLAPNQGFISLAELFGEEEYEKYKDRMVFSGEADQSGNIVEGSEKPYGMYINGYKYYSEITNEENFVLAVSATWKDKDSALRFIEFITK